MKLFNLVCKSSKEELNPFLLKTPFGNIGFSIIDPGKPNKKMYSSFFGVVKQDLNIYGFETDSHSFELLSGNICSVKNQVDLFYLFLLRFRTLNKSSELKFSCTLLDSKIRKGSIDTGEGVFAVSYESQDGFLVIGTEDEDYLRQRASSQNFLPFRFEKLIDSKVVEFIDDEIKISLPTFLKDEEGQIQFVVACGKEYAPTWLAVDVNSDTLLKNLK